MSNPVYIACIAILAIWLAVIVIIKSDTLDKLLCNIFCAVAGVALGMIIYFMLAPFAYQERGYFAIGGEGLVGYIIAWFVGPMLIWYLDEIIARHRKLLCRARDRKSLK